MGTIAERHHLTPRTINVENIGLVPNTFVAIGGTQQRQYQ